LDRLDENDRLAPPGTEPWHLHGIEDDDQRIEAD
jgi:hypothetical protein